MFWFANFGPRGILGPQLSSIVWSLCLAIMGLEGFWGSSYQLVSDLYVFEFRASRDSGAPTIEHCLVFLYVNFGPRGILGFQLSGIA